MSNTTYRFFVEKLGGSDATGFIGNEGEVFYDPTGNVLRLSDGTTPGGIVLGGGGGGQPTTWSRPTDWLAMTSVVETEEKFVGLFAVYDTPDNFLAVYFEGDYTVDWGDGTVEDFNSGDTAQHTYSWGDVSPSTVTTEGYRQVLVTVTPQAGQNLTLMDLTVRYDTSIISSSWKDIAVSMPNAATEGSLRFCGYEFGINSNGYLQEVERIRIIHSGGMTDFTECFYDFTSLKSVEILNAPSAEDFTYLFNDCNALIDITISGVPLVNTVYNTFAYCYSLKTVNISDMSSLTDASSMFESLEALRTVNISGITSVTNMSYMFQYCYSLENVTISDASSVQITNSMFYECYNLTNFSISGLTSSFTDCSEMFRYCYSLKTVPLFDTTYVENMNSMFDDCTSLESVPLYNTENVTSMNGMFGGCNSLTTVPLFNTTNVTNMGYMFSGCQALKEVPLFDTTNVTNMSYMFNDCYSLVTVPKFNAVSSTNCDGMFNYCHSLRLGTLDNVSTYISYLYCNLSRSAIIDIFNELETVVGESIFISANYGFNELTLSDQEIATNKNWTILS